LPALDDKIRPFLDTFFHLPTLIGLALLTLLLLWQLYGVSFYLGSGFVRMNSKQGDLTLHWAEGCCEIFW
jgi:hypothetical protein